MFTYYNGCNDINITLNMEYINKNHENMTTILTALNPHFFVTKITKFQTLVMPTYITSDILMYVLMMIKYCITFCSGLISLLIFKSFIYFLFYIIFKKCTSM